ncbi:MULTISPECIES: DsbC family protein [Burkholderia]|uniref:DsbC family protein n=1 Tax=Burkholderia TaxID=32008 RepID=UPI000762073D|nr:MULTISPECIES: DsbC family protein [Burkholderia]OXI71794.1 thiol:disulfide interchange protein [Burkholderia sp. AU31280]QRR16060.1 thioredoxin fold domain-containing protein [Burkholderia sp. MS389]QVN14368.1 DsbC family protein [Burkholderia sp. LAS2]CAG2331380.1 thiol:disulfide interchange protein DsbC [Burkholderia cenocepacia]CAG2331493.1 thiol:disulfide interchange protein DsbC [Burkholderia cenocepacia]
MPNNLQLLLTSLFTIALATAHTEAAAADVEANLQRKLQAKLPELKIEHVVPSKIDGLYEVTANSQIFYSNSSASHIIIGSLFDTNSQENITETQLNKINSININDLPFQYAIKQKNGTGERVIATFFDPNCSFCKKMSPELGKVPNATVYIFLYPILSTDSIIKSEVILCADNRLQAWKQWVERGKTTVPRKRCQSIITKELLSLGKKLNIKGTPTTFLPSGERVTGFISGKDLADKIDRNNHVEPRTPSRP